MSKSHLFLRKSQYYQRVLIFTLILIPFILINCDNSVVLTVTNYHSVGNSNTNPYIADEDVLGTPITESDKEFNSVGEIEITNFRINAELGTENFYGSLDPAIEAEFFDLDFIETVKRASSARSFDVSLNSRKSNITIRVNETIRWSYGDSISTFEIGFKPYIQSNALLQNVFVNETVANQSVYYPKYTDPTGRFDQIFFFDLEPYFNANDTGILYITYLYDIDIRISNWAVTSTPIFNEEQTGITDNSLVQLKYINGVGETFYQIFEYKVSFGQNIDATARFSLHMPDPDYVFNVQVGRYDNLTLIPDTNYTLTEDDVINFIFNTNLNETHNFNATFQAPFTVEFVDLVDSNSTRWFEDRLVDGLDIRERDYKLRITDGPANLRLENFGFNDTSIAYQDLTDISQSKSVLRKAISIIDLNETFTPDEEDIIPENRTGISLLALGMANLNPYYLFLGEVDVITVRYEAKHTLGFTVTDNIKVPLEKMKVNVKFGSQLYGTKINRYKVIPFGQKTTDSNGQIIMPYMPKGTYSIEIFNQQGVLICTLDASTEKTPYENLLVTPIPHFPATIITLGAIAIALLAIGFIIFKKSQ